MRKKPNWKIYASVVMIALSALFYYIHYLIFRDAHHIFIYLLGDIAFVFIEVLLVSIIINQVLNEWEKKSNLRKLNMVIEVFFSEFGKQLLGYLSAFDQNLDRIKKRIVCDDGSCDLDLKPAFRLMKKYKSKIDIESVDLNKLAAFLKSKRGFLTNLLQNPTLLEHETFTETLMAIFHITEELSARDLKKLSEVDRVHTKGDIERGYNSLMKQWLSYMQYTKTHYPYFFLFAMRTNPFNDKTTVLI
ncbi:MAG: hypothetical protein A2Y03_00270 [Omnitrophica WOR_2 bacterium GWF2_38_59]|nr:MAG: hypothetical protein A2Y06_04200 [Omnitrophica WOR_2 bacterium GWA2_37_7]OGX26579.1 MAG: hypothetical protein A2Y03_00270 [Omnitrophica WOR_2 bacterium GWF2_38_59]OGX47704.1 MAG: hypothetical protein A2243_00160 [Omnitrophica WOR_2 bacterium RIFOXYA2_FULL_38_17]OGX51401.1 MAG: hypothetical protein A2267_07455 [Omnitrophica WOR_2 bacterium RIFOXYA12_FULL_38_10]OGX56675.1 MAG: hypothetical protein A2306_08475 [Omnitrophica WOR_2 bacterium RIFOXYB2_FULL_38_16]OGX57765.1 MAG: hypothetical 